MCYKLLLFKFCRSLIFLTKAIIIKDLKNNSNEKKLFNPLPYRMWF